MVANDGLVELASYMSFFSVILGPSYIVYGSYFTTGLLLAECIAKYALWMIMAYLTDAWTMNFTHAAATVNIFTGSAMVMRVGISYLVDAFVGNYWMLLLSSSAYTTGLGLLWMSTPPVLSNTTGTCSTYEAACIGDVQKRLFYTALALVSIGMAGQFVSIDKFISEQILRGRNGLDCKDTKIQELKMQLVTLFGVIIVTLAAGIALPYIKPWSTRFGIPAICSVVATLLFISGSCSYVHVKPEGSYLTRVFRVFVASASKMHIPRPSDFRDLYERNDLKDELVLHTRGFRCLDKAAIVKFSQPLEEQEKNRWALCRVTEVEETKILLRMVPMGMTFIAIGLLLSTGNTFFLEQAKNMNYKVGKLKLQLPIFLVFYVAAKKRATMWYYSIRDDMNEQRRKYAPAVGIAVGMVLGILCCITAAKVEERKIRVIKEHNLLDKPDETIQMTVLWLLPQFLLLGALDGLAHGSVTSFFHDQVPTSMENYMVQFTESILGAGTVSAALSVYICHRASEQGEIQNWFAATLNRSRLDNYYWALAALSAANLILYVFFAIWYAYRDASVEEQPYGPIPREVMVELALIE